MKDNKQWTKWIHYAYPFRFVMNNVKCKWNGNVFVIMFGYTHYCLSVVLKCKPFANV